MPALPEVISGLRLNKPAVYDVGFFAASRANRAIDFHLEQRVRQHDDNIEDDRETAADVAGRVRYVRDHGFRAVGLVALFDQDAAIDLGARLLSLLQDADDPCWPLAYASAPLPPPVPGWGDSPPWSEVADPLAAEPASAARELARCVLPPALQQPYQPGRPQLTPRWDERRPGSRWSRQALAPYGIDLELLRTVVQGRAGGAEPLLVSDISMPALARTLFRSIEEALADAREDEFHWTNGVSTIQPTDPEVLLAVRACLRSEYAGAATRELPAELPMGRALVTLVEALDQG